MFDVPEAKRVRRDEWLPSRTVTPEPIDSDAASYAAAAFHKLFGQIETVDVTASADLQDAPNAGGGDATHAVEGEEHEYEFRLFNLPQSSAKSEHREAASSQSGHEGVQKLKIRLRSPSPGAEGDGGFVNPFRGWDYYLSAPDVILKNTALESEIAARLEGLRGSYVRRASNYAKAAVSHQDVLAFSKLQKAGCQLSWRVIHLKQSTAQPKKKKKQAASASTPVGSESPADPVQYLENPLIKSGIPKSRKKPGKKRRIMLRQRAHAKKQAEEADRDKRTARNREKKLKRRQREREKKAAVRASEGGPTTEDSAAHANDISMTEAR
ncbi:hypothetical protein KEM54_003202 [Ascosphaera aggregata]|nr:hypothetical protein KEM54_003202 [Ascosphaera aggregata]